MGMKPRREPEPIKVILQVRPATAHHPWWPMNADVDGWAWASMDPYDPPGWSAGLDPDYEIDSRELWKELKITTSEYAERIKDQWLEENGRNEDDDEGGGFYWEFRVVQINLSGAA